MFRYILTVSLCFLVQSVYAYDIEPHRKSEHVDYTVQHEFTYKKGEFLVDGMDAYRKQWIAFYGEPQMLPVYNYYDFKKEMSEIWVVLDNENGGLQNGFCENRFNTPNYTETLGFVQTHQSKFATEEDEKNHWKRYYQTACALKIRELVHRDVILDDKNGHAITYFFDELMPSFLENDSWLVLPSYRKHGEGFISIQQAIEHLMYTYIYFSDWYGTSDELDKMFVSYFRKFERTRHKHIKSDENSEFINKCSLDIYRVRPNPNGRKKDQHFDINCHKQEFWPMLYGYMAVRFQDNDILNEALFFFKHNAKYTVKEGATVEVTRGFRGPGYAIMASEFFAQGAWVIEQFTNTDVYSINGEGTYNNTVYDMIMSGIEAFQYPERYFKYAKWGQEMYGFDYRKPDLPTIPHNNYRVVGSILDASKSGKWDEYLNSVGDDRFVIKWAIDPLFMARAYNFEPSVTVE